MEVHIKNKTDTKVTTSELHTVQKVKLFTS